jgi:NAD-dependent DNA ligase
LFKYITVDGVGPKVVDKVIDLFHINSIEDFFNFLENSDETTLETLQNELGNSYGAKVYSGIKEMW